MDPLRSREEGILANRVAPKPSIPVPEIQRVTPSLVCVGPRLDPDLLRSLVRERLGWEPSPDVEIRPQRTVEEMESN